MEFRKRSIMSTIDNTILQTSNNNNNDNLNRYKPLPPISKIPGLNPDSELIASAEQKTFRTFKVLESDTSYIRLAKQGGRKNLLQYSEYSPQETKAEKVNKENLVLKKRPDLLDYQEHAPSSQESSPETKSPLNENNNNDDHNNNSDMKINKNSNKNNNNNNSSNQSNNSNTPGKSIMEIKKQSMSIKKGNQMMSRNAAAGKERPDILPVDNVEILKHLNVPRRQILPKMKNQPRKFKSHPIRVGGK